MAVRIPRDLARTSFSIRALWAAFALLGTWSADSRCACALPANPRRLGNASVLALA